jgi:hypothetical protein
MHRGDVGLKKLVRFAFQFALEAALGGDDGGVIAAAHGAGDLREALCRELASKHGSDRASEDDALVAAFAGELGGIHCECLADVVHDV